VRIFGIDPGSVRTGFGCVESDGSRHRLVRCGAITAPQRLSFPARLHLIHTALGEIIAD
jgi:crossover junction endodeoxyribonuclease RuvC